MLGAELVNLLLQVLIFTRVNCSYVTCMLAIVDIMYFRDVGIRAVYPQYSVWWSGLNRELSLFDYWRRFSTHPQLPHFPPPPLPSPLPTASFPPFLHLDHYFFCQLVSFRSVYSGNVVCSSVCMHAHFLISTHFGDACQCRHVCVRGWGGGGGGGGGMAGAPECQKLAKQQYDIYKRIDKSIYE